MTLDEQMDNLIRRIGIARRRIALFDREELERLYVVVGRTGVLRKVRQEGDGARRSGTGFSSHHGGGGADTAPDGFDYELSRGD